MNRKSTVASFDGAAMVAAEPGKAHRGAQFPELGLLLPGDVQGFAVQFFSSLGMALPQQ